MTSNKFTGRRSAVKKPPICIPPPPRPPVLPPPPPWPPLEIWLHSDLTWNGAGGPESWSPDGKALKASPGYYNFTITDPTRFWTGTIQLNYATRVINGSAYGFSPPSSYFGLAWYGPILPTPWLAPVPFITTYTYGLTSEASTVRPYA